MIGPKTREAIVALKEKQVPIRHISRILKISRNTVRSVLREKPCASLASSRTEEIAGLAAELLAQCKGNLVRVREILKECHGIEIAYSTLTRLVRPSKANTPKRVGSYSFAPAEEAQHDTSPHRLLIAGKAVTAQCAALVLAYSRKAFIQYYPAFTRLEARHFLSQAFCFMAGACERCVIDNTSVIVAQGAGPDARIAPEMEGFAQIFRTRFVPHRVGDPDRKARVERLFAYVEGNFLAGRNFSDWFDLNLQALRWCTEVANTKVKRSLGMSPEAAYLMERPHLLPLPPYVPPVYQALARIVDSEGFVHVDTNRYSVPEKLIGKRVQVLKFWDRIEVIHANEGVAEHQRRIGEHDRRISLAGHHQVRSRSLRSRPSPEEAILRGQSPILDSFVCELKKRSAGRAIRPLKRLLDLKRTYPEEPFLAACTKALDFGLFDLARIEKMILSSVAGEFFQIPDEEEKP
jgi:transposase